jgi:hypothetical protein
MSSEALVFRAIAGLAFVMAAASAHASFSTYATQSAFSAATTLKGADTFDDLTAGELGVSMQRTTAGISYTVSSPSGLYGVATTSTAISNDDRRDVITFSGFSAPVTAIGAAFFGTNESGIVLSNQSLWVTVTDTSNAQSTTLLTANSASSFFGVASTLSIVSLTVSVDPSNLLTAWPTVDNLTLAAAVPEPATWALLAAGIGLVAGAARRRQGAR